MNSLAFKGKLLDFQREDLEKLAKQQNVLVGSEMGTGKTYLAIALDLERRKNPPGRARRTLVIAPLSVLSVWQTHYAELTDLKMLVTDNSTKAKREARWNEFVEGDYDVFGINWESVRLLPQLAKYNWLHVIADECHKLGNRDSAQTKAVKKIRKAKFKTGLSGTLGEKDIIWSPLNWLHRPTWPSYWDWYHEMFHSFVPVDKDGEPLDYRIITGLNDAALPLFHRQIEPFFVRRMKKDVLTELPDKYYTEIVVDMVPKQARAYHSMRKNMLAWVGEQEDELLAAPLTVAKLTRLAQMSNACMELDRVDDNGKEFWHLIEPSPKIDALMELLSNSEQPIVVFSQFAMMVNLIEQRLIKADISYSKLIGAVPQADRGNLVQDFQNGASRIFLATIAAGGEGITLTRASTLVFMDRTYSVRMNSQAEDRAHRIGQKNALQVIDFMSRGSIDMGRKTTLEYKKTWIKKLLGDS